MSEAAPQLFQFLLQQCYYFRNYFSCCVLQFAKVQFGRHVMQHHNNVLSDYLHEQLLSLSWNEFQQAMAKAQSVDDMHYAHANYLNSMICRLVFGWILLNYYLSLKLFFSYRYFLVDFKNSFRTHFCPKALTRWC